MWLDTCTRAHAHTGGNSQTNVTSWRLGPTFDASAVCERRLRCRRVRSGTELLQEELFYFSNMKNKCKCITSFVLNDLYCVNIFVEKKQQTVARPIDVKDMILTAGGPRCERSSQLSVAPLKEERPAGVSEGPTPATLSDRRSVPLKLTHTYSSSSSSCQTDIIV